MVLDQRGPVCLVCVEGVEELFLDSGKERLEMVSFCDVLFPTSAKWVRWRMRGWGLTL